ncbi:MAG TPA: hypothetical protein VF676_02845 [Flavobacterium sp.]|jgi:hypothetical protein
MMTDETKPSDFKNIRGGDYSHIKGWGIDADPDNDPTYPMKNRTNEEHRGYTWDRPEQQTVNVELLKSVERPNVTAVFGTSTPPSGLSGMIRRYAFKYSESSYGRWLPLVMADRIGVYEGIIDDFAHGHFPNFFKERGWGAEWKYNRKSFVTKVAVGAVVTAAIVALLMQQQKKKRSVMH